MIIPTLYSLTYLDEERLDDDVRCSSLFVTTRRRKRVRRVRRRGKEKRASRCFQMTLEISKPDDTLTKVRLKKFLVK